MSQRQTTVRTTVSTPNHFHQITLSAAMLGIVLAGTAYAQEALPGVVAGAGPNAQSTAFQVFNPDGSLFSPDIGPTIVDPGKTHT